MFLNFSAALCSAKEPALIDETFKFVLAGAKDQDVYMFIAFLASNVITRRRMAEFFKENYDEVRRAPCQFPGILTPLQIYRRFSTNTQLAHFVSVRIDYLFACSLHADLEGSTPSNTCHLSKMRRMLRPSSRVSFSIARKFALSQTKSTPQTRTFLSSISGLHQALDTIRAHDAAIKVFSLLTCPR